MGAEPRPLRPNEVQVRSLFEAARAAQPAWAALPIRERLAVLRRVRLEIAADPLAFARSVDLPWREGPTETLAAEVAPLVDAIRELERSAARVLRSRRHGRRGRPIWQAGMRAEVRRRPLGLVLVIGPSNYPVMLPGIQALQALVAGNAVIVKPGEGGEAGLRALGRTLIEAGLPEGLFGLLDESSQSARLAVQAGADHVVLTGATETGRAVMRELAETLTPSTMELSGADACFVLPDADLELTARALRFGLELNGGASCIAPRRAFVARGLLPELEALLARELAPVAERPASEERVRRVTELLDEAVERGGRLAFGRRPEAGRLGPIVVSDLGPDARLVEEEHFGPMLALFAVDDVEEALALDERCPEALGASVFSRDEDAARSLAERIDAGVVTINDCVAPTGDPRLPFGGSGSSGFGVTRGHEGLLALTAPQVVTVTRGRRRHLERLGAGAEHLLSALIRWTRAGSGRLAALRDVVRAARSQRAPDDRADGRQP